MKKDNWWFTLATLMFLSFWTMQYITPVPFFMSFVGILYLNYKY